MGNRSAVRPVIQDVGKRRGVGAALLAAGLVLSGCASGDDQAQTTTTTSAVAENSANPWDLPLEQRPPLFDPCAEIPIEAVEEGVGSALEPEVGYSNMKSGELTSCGWTNDEVHIGLLSTWKSRADYLADGAFVVKDSQAEVGGRNAIRLSDTGDNTSGTCVLLFFTPKGAVWFSLDLATSLNRFKENQFSEACTVIDEAVEPIMEYLPGGDVQ